jgi:hypothetical protein
MYSLPEVLVSTVASEESILGILSTMIGFLIDNLCMDRTENTAPKVLLL